MKKGWTYKKLGEVCHIGIGRTPSRSDMSLWDKEKRTHNYWVSIADIGTTKNGIVYDTKEYISDKAAEGIQLIPKGTLLLSFKLTLGKTAIAGNDLYTNEAIANLPFIDNEVVREFLIYYFQYFNWEKFSAGDEKVLGKTLNKKKLDVLPIYYPPLVEQQQIVERLDAAFARIDKLKANAEKQLSEARALFQKALEESMKPKEGWEEKTLKEVGEVIGGTTPNTSNPAFWGGDICWISPAELHGEHYLYDSVKKITKEAVAAKRLKQLPEGTVILSSRAPIGKIAINKVPMYCNQGFKCIVCDSELYNEYLYWWLYGKKEYLNSLGTGATFPEISKTVVENIIIPVPPLADQQRIVAHLDALSEKVREMEELQKKTIAECDALKQAILREVFE